MAKFQFTLRGALLFTALFALLLGIMSPMVRRIWDASRTTQCEKNMKQLLLAVHLYHDIHGCFPPAYIPDAHDLPKHSWRVLLLPHLGEDALYRRYRFDEPWNGPNNRQLADEMPEVFRCPLDSSKGFTTSYVAVVGSETVWPGATSKGINDITDGTTCTIMLVESAGSGIHWMEPRDISFDAAIRKTNMPGQPTIQSGHSAHGPTLGFADGTSTRHLSENDLSPKWLRSLLTIRGKEPVPGFYY